MAAETFQDTSDTSWTKLRSTTETFFEEAAHRHEQNKQCLEKGGKRRGEEKGKGTRGRRGVLRGGQ